MWSVNRLRSRREGTGGLSRDRVVVWFLAALSCACSVIHFGAAGDHFRLYWVFGALMLMAASLQLLWALAVVPLRPSRPLLAAGFLLNGGIVCVYLITRTVGYVIGPYPHQVEAVGFEDAYCTALEAIIVLGCGWLFLAPSQARVSGTGFFASLAIMGGATAFLLSVSLVTGGPHMVMHGA